MKRIIEQIGRLSYDKRQTIEVRRDTLEKINKLIGAAMYYNGSSKISKSDIIAHSVDFFYNSIMKEMGTFEL